MKRETTKRRPAPQTVDDLNFRTWPAERREKAMKATMKILAVLTNSPDMDIDEVHRLTKTEDLRRDAEVARSSVA